MGRGGKRSVDKELKNVNVAVTFSGTSNNATNLFPGSGGVTFPCTISGVRVMGTVWNATSSSTSDHFWAVAIQRQGETIPAISFTTAGSTLTPEEDVMVWGRGATVFNTTSNYVWWKNYDVAGTTKRKLMIGDQLMFVANVASGSPSTNMALVVQWFVIV